MAASGWRKQGSARFAKTRRSVMKQNKLALGTCVAFLLAQLVQPAENRPVSLEKLEDELFFLVNHERSLRGLPELKFEARLRALAREHSKKMAEERRLSHDFPGENRLAVRALQGGLRFAIIGENLAVGDTYIMLYFHEQMLASPGHGENILEKKFTHLGVGIEKRGGKYYITQEFAGLY
jgi:uncharacterized protein YkwD